MSGVPATQVLFKLVIGIIVLQENTVLLRTIEQRDGMDQHSSSIWTRLKRVYIHFSVRNSSCLMIIIICDQLKVNGLDSLDVTFSYCARGEDEEVGSLPSAISFKLMSTLVLWPGRDLLEADGGR